MEQVLYKLPDGWEWSNLTDVCTPSRKTVEPNPEEQYNYIGLENIESHTGKVISNSPTKGSEISSTKVSFKKGMVLYGKLRPYLNKVVVAKIDGIATTEIIPFECSDVISPDFLAYYLRSQYFVDLAMNNCSGARMPRATTKLFTQIAKVPVTSITEQKRIVEKLDALLTRIDTAIEHLQSKLDLSRQLFDSVLDELFKLSDCDSVPLTEVVDFIGGSQPPKSQFSDVQKEGYVRLIQIRDYKTDNHIVYVDSASTKKFCTKDDVMIGRYGPPVFQILRGLNGAYNVALMKAVPNEDLLTKDYLFWFLQSPSIQNYVIGISQRAAGQSGVNKKALEKYLIPVPNKTIQHDIVDKVGRLVNKSRNLEAEVAAEMTSLNQLKASILDSAFKGEL
ncbi:restriction endonuclease subunit S [Vibrio metschnikovii]|nr:restriction endonuclease subunit S [Vibrio metschnikovii]